MIFRYDQIFYDILTNHTPEFAQQRLDVLIPHLRYQLCVILDLPKTPLLQFIHYNPEKEDPFSSAKLVDAIK